MSTPDYKNEAAIREWLLAYLKPGAEGAAEVDCIMAQDGWRYLDAMADKFAGAQWEPGPEAFSEGVEFALSALVECHDGPHVGACPSLAWEMNLDRYRKVIEGEMAEGKVKTVTFYRDGKQIGEPMVLTATQIAEYNLEPGWTMDIAAEEN